MGGLAQRPIYEDIVNVKIQHKVHELLLYPRWEFVGVAVLFVVAEEAK